MNNFNNTGYTTGIFYTNNDPNQTILLQSDRTKNVNVLLSDDTVKKFDHATMVVEEGDKSMDGLGIGGATGGAIGGVVAAIAAIGTSIAIPGFGLVVAGPLAAGLAGAGIGSITGGLVGSLIGWSIPETHVREYETDDIKKAA